MNRTTLVILALFACAIPLYAEMMPDPESGRHLLRGPVATDPGMETFTLDIDNQNRVHRAGSMWMNFTNWGYFGNYSVDNNSAMLDPEYPDLWAPQCEFPGGSEVQYLYQGTVWVGALIQEEGIQYPRVSTGTEGWILPRIHEFYPGETPDPIIERSTRPNAYNRLGDYVTSDDAISEQDFVAVYTDTLTDQFYVETDPLDNAHFPLGIKITQTSYSWSYAYARDFIIIDWEIENIADNFLKNLYVGLYIDGDVGAIWEQSLGTNEGHTDDICGFQRFYYYETAEGEIDSAVINTAWIADNDGRPAAVDAGNDFVTPHVTGVRVVRAPNPQLRTSFNWWISNGTNDALDFGPAWQDDESQSDWTGTLGTPLGDSRKYFVMGNHEFDYDQVLVDDGNVSSTFQDYLNPVTMQTERHYWREPDAGVAQDLANGYDTRYLLSWGPLGIFDYVDPNGERIYRLNPGERFSMTVGYVAGENFHDKGNYQDGNEIIDQTKFDFSDLQYNADWVAKVYDNPMYDTNGDGWYGEDTGIDHLYAEEEGPVYIDGVLVGVYNGPDEGERDGKLQPEEDANPYKPARYDYSTGNMLLDHGDNEPDFRGPPPPPIPDLKEISDPNHVILTWGKMPSEAEDYRDPFSQIQDFEGYRVYVSNTGLENDYSFLAEYDRLDYSYYSPNDSMMVEPFTDREGRPAITMIDGITATLKPVGSNTGLDQIWDAESESYVYVHENANPLIPRWYAVTVFDFGDPSSGTPPLESSKGANAIYTAPSGNPNKKPMVVPNPYRIDQNYTVIHGDGSTWENRDDGTDSFYPQTDRRMYFFNLPEQCLIRIYTVSGDLVQIIAHNQEGDSEGKEEFAYAEAWDLNSRNNQQIVSGLYLFSVEDKTEENDGKIQTGKFVVIR